MWERSMKTVPNLTSNSIYFEEFFTISKRFFDFISHVRWVYLYKDYL